MTPKNLTIAIDGHSSCGKSTVAKEIAKTLGLTYIDTGAMYRAVTYYALQNGLIKNEKIDVEKLEEAIKIIDIQLLKNKETSIDETFLNGKNVSEEIRTLEVSSHVSAVSALGFVRKRLVELQRKMGSKGSVVLDGRDIGTVVFPNADLKIFMTASAEIRAQRRFDEMIEKGEKVTFSDVFDNVKKRDHIDSTRSESPLKKADDAVVIDNSALSREEQLEVIIKIIKEKMVVLS